MRRIERYYFTLPPLPGKRARRKIWEMMTPEEAAAKYPDVEIDSCSKTVHFEAETPEEKADQDRRHGSNFEDWGA